LTLFADIVWEEKILKHYKNCVKTRQNYSRRNNKRQDMMRQDSDTAPLKYSFYSKFDAQFNSDIQKNI
jgi:hypothetical protein